MKLNIIRPPVLIALSVICCIAANAQQPDKGTQMYSPRLLEKLKPTSLHYWLDIREEEKIKTADFLKEYKTDLRLTADDDFKLYREAKDQDGNSHNRFQQYYKGIKIEGAECIVHELNGLVKSVNGRWTGNMNANTKPSVNELQALNEALNNIKSKDHLWKHKDADKYEKLIKEKSISLQPKGELVFCRINSSGDFEPANITLAWKFTVLVLPMNESATVYIDAAKGTVMNKIPVSLNCTIGSGATTWYGTRSFSTSWRGWPDNTYHLDVDEGGCANYTNIMSRRGDPIIPYNYGDGDNAWYDADGVNGYNMRAGVTTHWSLINAYNYYRYTHGRLSYNNGNAELSAFSEITGGSWLSSPDNAAWNSTFHTMHFGADFTSSPSDDWNCIDIVGHEMTHGVVQYAAGLVYSYESGALNESFADIFGEMIDGYGTGTIDWLMGADRGAIRSFSNPNAFYQPDTYGVGSDYWYTGSGDNGGVHYNSGVQNYWFYLLSLGGSGTNDLGRSYAVSALGTTTAAAIAYRNLELYLVSSSVYVDAREGAIRAAEDLYGACSNAVIQTAKAWYAVGVGYDQYVNGAALCGTYSGSSLNIWKNPDAINVGQFCTVSFSSTGTGSNTIMSGTSITFYPGATVSPTFTAYISSCAVAAYSLTALLTHTNAAVVSTSATANSISKPVIQQSPLTVYPNPAVNYITIKSAGIINRNACFITDVSGRRFACTFTNANMVDISTLSPGVYFISIAVDGKTKAVKFVKQ